MSDVHLRLSSRVRSGLHADWNIVGRCAHAISKLENMSAGGAFVRTSVPAPTGTRLQMHLLTDGGIVPTLARVVRSEPSGMGIRFEASETMDVPFEVQLDEIDAD